MGNFFITFQIIYKHFESSSPKSDHEEPYIHGAHIYINLHKAVTFKSSKFLLLHLFFLVCFRNILNVSYPIFGRKTLYSDDYFCIIV